MSMTTFGSRLSTCNRVLQKERLLTYGVISPGQSRGISPLQGGGVILGEVKARPKDIISFSLDYISKSKVQTSNPSSSPIPLDTPARPADFRIMERKFHIFGPPFSYRWFFLCVPTAAACQLDALVFRLCSDLPAVVGHRSWKESHGEKGVKKTNRCIWVFPKIGVPQNGWFIMEILKWMIWGYPYFRKHPYTYLM